MRRLGLTKKKAGMVKQATRRIRFKIRMKEAQS
jgi:hypothetical protein